MKRRGLLVGLMGLGLLACHDVPPTPDAATQPPEPTLTRVTADRADLLFRYPGETPGSFERAGRVDEIPAAKRGRVQVVDLSLGPKARGATRFVQVFDLRQAGPDGSFPGRLVPRAELEAALAKQTARPPQKHIVMYSASWCGVCKKARRFLSEQGIAFVEKDIEKDPGAGRELREKAKRAGIDPKGVPVFDVGGKLMSGFDGPALLKAARGG